MGPLMLEDLITVTLSIGIAVAVIVEIIGVLN